MDGKRKAALLATLAILILLGGSLLGLAFRGFEIEFVAAAFAGYVACGRRAMILWRADGRVFDDGRRPADEQKTHTARLAAAETRQAYIQAQPAKSNISSFPAKGA